MARRKIVDLDADKTVAFANKGDSFQGYYLGSRKVSTGMGEANFHVFNYENENVGVWGSAKLDQLLGQVNPGTMTYITYNGKRSLGGGRSLKTYTVECDDENVLSGIMIAKGDESSEEVSSSIGDSSTDIDIDEVDSILAERS